MPEKIGLFGRKGQQLGALRRGEQFTAGHGAFSKTFLYEKEIQRVLDRPKKPL
jgi:hypothetical protein